MSKKKFIAMGGMSAAGKRTLIQKILSADQSSSLRARFGIGLGETIKACGADFGGLNGRFNGADVLLFKWQWDDNAILNEYCRHDYDCYAYVLWAPWKIAWSDWSGKWKDQVDDVKCLPEEHIRQSWMGHVKPRFCAPFAEGHELDPRVRIEVVDRTTELYEAVPGQWEAIDGM